MIRWLGNRLADGAAALLIVTILFEGPAIAAVVREKIKRA